MAAAAETYHIGLGRRMTNAISRLPNTGVLLFLGGVAVGMSVGSARVNNLFIADTAPGWWAGWLQNFSTEMFGAFLTFILLELIVSTRDRRNRLIRQMGSNDNGLAQQAVSELRAEGWLYDGSLQRARLRSTNLQGARLENANLQEANLMEANLLVANLLLANLQGAFLHSANLEAAVLSSANLQEADLAYAKLQGADLWEANLQEANLAYANLQRARLRSTNLQGALLSDANLQEAILDEVEFSEDTALPDGKKWTPDTDMARFTDLNHPDYWRSDHRGSPAYRGDDDDGGTP